jgi:hypothetical protein
VHRTQETAGRKPDRTANPRKTPIPKTLSPPERHKPTSGTAGNSRTPRRFGSVSVTKATLPEDGLRQRRIVCVTYTFLCLVYGPHAAGPSNTDRPAWAIPQRGRALGFAPRQQAVSAHSGNDPYRLHFVARLRLAAGPSNTDRPAWAIPQRGRALGFAPRQQAVSAHSGNDPYRLHFVARLRLALRFATAHLRPLKGLP